MTSPTPGSDALLIDAHEAARRLGISPRTLHDLAKTGTIPSVRLGRRRLYRPATIDARLAEIEAQQAATLEVANG